MLNGKWHSLGKACNLTVRRDHGNALRLAGLRRRCYIDGIIGASPLQKPAQPEQTSTPRWSMLTPCMSFLGSCPVFHCHSS